MKTILKFLLFLMVCCFLAAGCSDGSNESQTAYNDVYARINGKIYSTEMISNRVMVAAAFLQSSGRPVKKKLFPVWANSRAAKLFPVMLSADVFEDELKRMGVSPTVAATTEILKKYNQRTKLDAKTIDEFVDKLDVDKDTLRGMINRDVLFESFYASNPDCNVSDKEVFAHIASVSNQVSELREFNKSVLDKGDLIHKKLIAGESWENIAAEYSEDKLEDEENSEYSREWETFTLKDFYLKEVSEAVRNLSKGQITKPLDTDEGLLIVKVNDIDDGLYTCSRILLRMANVPEIPSFEIAKRQIVQKKRVAAQRKVISAAWKNLKIEYPKGTNFTMRIWPMPNRKGVKLQDGRTFYH